MKKFLSVAFCLALVACAIPGRTNAPSSPEKSSSASARVAAGCKLGGCSGQHCLDADAEDSVTICDWQPKYACYRTARCEKQADGRCGWTMTEKVTQCLKSPPEDAVPFMAP